MNHLKEQDMINTKTKEDPHLFLHDINAEKIGTQNKIGLFILHDIQFVLKMV